jgi:chromosome segregation ATPase
LDCAARDSSGGAEVIEIVVIALLMAFVVSLAFLGDVNRRLELLRFDYQMASEALVNAQISNDEFKEKVGDAISKRRVIETSLREEIKSLKEQLQAQLEDDDTEYANARNELTEANFELGKQNAEIVRLTVRLNESEELRAKESEKYETLIGELEAELKLKSELIAMLRQDSLSVSANLADARREIARMKQPAFTFEEVG